MTRTSLPTKKQLMKEIRELMAEAHLNKTGLAQLVGRDKSIISRIFSQSRGLDYEEAKSVLDSLVAALSSIPPDAIGREYGTLELDKTTVEEPFVDAVTRMLKKGYSQLPVLDDKGKYVGMITEMSVLRFLLSPESRQVIGGKGLGRLIVGDLLEVRSVRRPRTRGLPEKREPKMEEGYLDEAPAVPIDTQMRVLGTLMRNHYAVLLEEDDIPVGIITRADFLKLEKILKTNQTG
jgi:predicted transcriptional regulator